MKTIEYLTGPNAELFRPAIVAGIAIALQASLLSVPVVLRRLAFIGQGVSHAAFGGVGLAVILGLMGTGAGGAQNAGALALIAAFCIATAIGIAWLSGKGGAREDTVIGIFLVGAMALGAILLHLHRRIGAAGGPTPPVEDLLFGSIFAVTPGDAQIAAWLTGAIALALWWFRRPLLFWSFDEPAAEAFGVPTARMKLLLLVLLAVSIVASMKLAGVILATALLVLPGATALNISRRLGVVLALSITIGLIGMLGGLVLSFETDLPPGPAVVGVLCAIYALAWPASRMARATQRTESLSEVAQSSLSRGAG
ncbi:MAG TPA: metal ABC transporter permease [Phycisphaerales bacterium]|nr:metal ABC transporter permease [Phycisphaerales bacterium]